MAKVTVFGSANMDLVATVRSIPRPGETVMGTGFLTAFGGKGANEAVAAARLGAQVSFVACLGNDAFGRRYLEQLNAEGIDTSAVCFDDDLPTGCALITVQENQGENCIVVCPGANGSLSPDRVQSAASKVADADVVLVQYEIPHESVLEVMKLAESHRKPLVFNLSPIDTRVTFSGRRIDYLIVNETEAEKLTGCTVSVESDCGAAAASLHSSYATHVIITRGSQSTFISSNGKQTFVPCEKVDPVDTVGAGDTFAGAFATALAEGMNIEQAVRFGSKAASLAILQMGAQTSMPRREEVGIMNYEL